MTGSDESNLEIEVKFIAPDLATARQRMLNQGGGITKGRVYERNVVYDTPGQDLRRTKKLLRLRQDERVRLTFKGEPQIKIESEAKVREEVEVTVDDFDRMETIISRLGFEPFIMYEKYRETIEIGSVEAVLDELPYGSFVELEGPEADIKQLAQALGLDWGKRVLTNYLGLHEKAKAAYSLDFTHLSFENYKDLDIDWAAVLA